MKGVAKRPGNWYTNSLDMNRFFFSIILVLCIGLGVLCLESWAYVLPLSVQKVSSQNLEAAEVHYNSNVIMRFFSSLNGLTPYQRAVETVDNLQQMVALGLSEKDIIISNYRDQIQAQIDKNKVVFTVTEKEAKINQTSPEALAKEWMGRIKSVFDDIPNYWLIDYTVSDPKTSLPLRCFAKSYIPADRSPHPYFIAAHSFLPFGTRVRVTNLITRWTVVVVIEERIKSGNSSMVLLEPQAAKAIGVFNNPQIVKLEEAFL